VFVRSFETFSLASVEGIIKMAQGFLFSPVGRAVASSVRGEGKRAKVEEGKGKRTSPPFPLNLLTLASGFARAGGGASRQESRDERGEVFGV
jgi:hypothetical protein